MQQTLLRISKVSRSRCPVLILGETGTGKEVVARSIHNANPVGRFIAIDCSSLVGPLMESELFGHAKGSFTGALVAKTGLLELANGGTAFLDEIGELPLDLQAKLLRVLQEKEFRPVGSTHVRQSDFRVIAATNRDLANEVKKGRFRQDLYYRLNVVSIRLAPLRDRKEDIPPLVAHFVHQYGNGHRLTGELSHAIQEYNWPGNVRELENAVQHMVALNSGPLLHPQDLPSSIRNQRCGLQSDAQGLAALAEATNSWAAQSGLMNGSRTEASSHSVVPLTRVEKHAILEALAYANGDRATTASLLGIGRTTLYRKLKEYEIQ